jgi:hypothetical protein
MVDTIDRLLGARTTFGMKKPVAAATTANITLSGEQTIDGVACTAGDRVLVKDQSTTANNGIYIVDTGEWTRAVDFDGTTDWCQGTTVVAAAGTVNGGKIYRVTTADPADVGTSAISFQSLSFGDAHANTSIVAATTLDLSSADADYFDVTGGGVTITTITVPEGYTRIVRFTDAGNVLTASATLGLPGSQNITTTANDRLILRGHSGGITRVIAYQRGDSYPLITGGTSLVSATTTDLGSVREQHIVLTGSTDIASFGTSAPSGAVKFITAGGAFSLIHSSAINLPGGRDIRVASGDFFIARQHPSGWSVINYTRGAFQPHTDVTATSNASTAESDLLSYSLPAGRLASSGAGIRIKAWGTGTTVSTAATRRLRLYFGAQVIADTGAQNVPTLWGLEVTLLRTTVAGIQETFSQVLASTGGAASVLYQRTSPAENLNAAVTIKVTGLCTASTGVLTQTGFVVEQLSI